MTPSLSTGEDDSGNNNRTMSISPTARRSNRSESNSSSHRSRALSDRDKQLEIPLTPSSTQTPPSPDNNRNASPSADSTPNNSNNIALSTGVPKKMPLLSGVPLLISSNNYRGVEWKRLQPCSVARQDMASTLVLQGERPSSRRPPSPVGILVVGGRSEEMDLAALDVVELFDWSSKRWRTLPPLQQARCGCAVASLNKTIFVFGGIGVHSGDVTVSKLVEIFSLDCPGQQTWTPLLYSPMPEPRWHAQAVTLPYHGDIILLGGRDPSTWRELDSVQCLNIDTKEWSSLADMTCPRFACGATRVSDNRILVCGGYNGMEWTDSCEVLDYTENNWERVADLPLPDLQFITATTLNEDFVLCSGQRDDLGDGGSVWMVYQVSKNEWTMLPLFPPSVSEELVGCSLTAVGGKYVVAVGGADSDGLPTKNTRISINLWNVLKLPASTRQLLMLKGVLDDGTVQTFRSSGSNTRNVPFAVATGESYHELQQQQQAYQSQQQQQQQLPYVLSPIPSTSKPPAWSGPVSHIQLMDQSVSVVSGESGSNDSSSQLPDEDFSASTSMDASYDVVSPRGQRQGKKKSKRQSVQDMSMVDGNGMAVVYNGQVLNGRPSGKGRMSWENGDYYVGAFKHGQRHGKGCQSYSDGRQYEGRFVGNFAHDPNGTMTWKDGTLYVGAFVQGKRTGSGIQRFSSGVRYEGEFVYGKYHGRGVCSFADGSMYNGEWIQGKAHGTGILRDKQGNILYNGLWQDDSPLHD